MIFFDQFKVPAIKFGKSGFAKTGSLLPVFGVGSDVVHLLCVQVVLVRSRLLSGNFWERAALVTLAAAQSYQRFICLETY